MTEPVLSIRFAHVRLQEALAGAETAQVKATTTDGFTSESSVTTLKVTDLV
jgi:hypothetical protein